MKPHIQFIEIGNFHKYKWFYFILTIVYTLYLHKIYPIDRKKLRR